jgi:hypothetical protein
LLALLEVYVASFSSDLRFNWVRSGPEFRSFLKDATNYYITAQVGALGIVSIAIGLITLIAQRRNARREIQIYYHESLAREVVASSVALLVVLCVQIFWPIEMLIQQFGLGISSNNFESTLTIIHTAWLAVNLSALAHFVAMSLGFVQPGEREEIRRRYTANWVIPHDLTERLLRARYVGASLDLSSEHGNPLNPFISFGYELEDADQVELQSTFRSPVLLYDARMKALSWAIRRWQRRCLIIRPDLEPRRAAGHRPRLIFKPSFDRTLEGPVAWCTRHGGVSLTRFERLLIRWSFRFRKTQNET